MGSVEYDGNCAISRLSENEAVLVVYYEDWCARSIRLKGMASKIRDISEIKVVTVDIEKYRREASMAGCLGPPLIQLWSGGEVVSTFSGLSWAEEIAGWIWVNLAQRTATTAD